MPRSNVLCAKCGNQVESPELFDPEAEAGVLGAIQLDHDILNQVKAAGLVADDFFIDRYRWIFESMEDLAAAGQRCDSQIILADHLEGRGLLEKVGGPAELSRLLNVAVSASYGVGYADIVSGDGNRRRLTDLAGALAKKAHDKSDRAGMVSSAQELFAEFLRRAAGRSVGRGMTDIVQDVMNDFERAVQMAEAGKAVGLATGLTDLDRMLGGLRPRRMYTLAASTGMGKSALAQNIAWNVGQAGGRVLFFTLEMDKKELVQRQLGTLAGVPANEIDLGRADVAKVNRGFVQFNNNNIKVIDEAVLTPNVLRQKVLAELYQNGLDLVIIDYLQLMTGDKRSSNRQEEVSAISRSIKVLAGEAEVPILALSQLNRSVSSRPDKRPVLSDLRDSGAIEQDSDVVLFMYRDDYYNPDTEFKNIAEVNVAKNRAGKTGGVSLYFQPALTRFADLEIRQVPLEY